MATQSLVKRSEKVRDDEVAETPKAPATREEMLADIDALVQDIDEVLDVEVEASATLKLSDLIRLGAKEHPQAIGQWYGEQGETCALSAAYDGAKKLGLV